MSTPSTPSTWLEQFRAETASVIAEPFFRCLAEAIAIVESAAGRKSITAAGGLNEIGYKAVPGHPSMTRQTQEATPSGELVGTVAGFRLFRDRAEQARALLWLLRTSHFYDAARLLFILTFYSAYAPGRTAGAREVLREFNALAASGAHDGVRPLCLAQAASSDDADLLAYNHDAARAAVRLFADLTATPR